MIDIYHGYEIVWLGAVIGLTTVFVQRVFLQSRSNARRQKAVETAILSRLTAEGVKQLCGSNFPPWVTFPEFERVKWINAQLTEIWPFVNKAASTIIKDIVEPKLEQFRPPVIKSILFEKLTLGDVAPQLGGIKFQKLAENRISLDIDLKWGGDPKIVVDIDTGLVLLPVQLKDLKFFATAHIILEFAQKIPVVAAVVVSLLGKPFPVVSYNLKAIGGSVSAIPGLTDMVANIINDALQSQIIWPKRVVQAIIPGYDVSHLVQKIQGSLTVTVLRANGVKNVDVLDDSDPYVSLWTRSFAKERTRVVDNCLNPEWNETFELDVDEVSSTTLTLKVFDEGMLKHEQLGYTEIPVADLVPETETEITHFLSPANNTGMPFNKDRNLGTITFKVTYHVFDPEEQAEVMKAEKELLEAKKTGKAESLGRSASRLFSERKRFKAAARVATLVGGFAKSAHGAVSSVTGAALHGISEVGSIGKVGAGTVSGAAKQGVTEAKAGMSKAASSISRVFKGPPIAFPGPFSKIGKDGSKK